MTPLRLRLVGLLAAATLSLAACGGGGGGGEGQPTVAGTTFDPVTLAGPVGGSFSAGVAINEGGLAVGFADDGTNVTGIRWTLAPGAATVPGELLVPLADNSYSAAYGVNDLNIAVGESSAADDARIVAVYWDENGAPVALDTTGLFPGGASAALAIGLGGEIVGEAVADGDGNTVAVYWASLTAAPLVLGHLPGGTFSSAYALGADGRIVGEAQNDLGQAQAVMWLPAAGGGYMAPVALAALPGQLGSVALGVDPSGRMVGEVELESGVLQGVVWNANGSVAATLGAATSAQAISGGDRIAGYTGALSGGDRAALWNGSNLADTKNLAAAFSQVYGLNDSSQAVGVASGQAFAVVPR